MLNRRQPNSGCRRLTPACRQQAPADRYGMELLPGKENRMAKQIHCVFGVDIDAVAGWLGSYGGEDSPSDIQRGVFAGGGGTPRVVRVFPKDTTPPPPLLP